MGKGEKEKKKQKEPTTVASPKSRAPGVPGDSGGYSGRVVAETNVLQGAQRQRQLMPTGLLEKYSKLSEEERKDADKQITQLCAEQEEDPKSERGVAHHTRHHHFPWSDPWPILD